MLNEKIKRLRKANNLTQEELADRISVSRQAITKWETGLGTPDIGNLEALAKAFGVTIDELLSDEAGIKAENVSRTEFDIFGKSDFHLDIGTAAKLEVSSIDAEKVIVEIRSDLPSDAYKLAKVKLTDGKKVDLILVERKTDKKYLDVKADKSLSRAEAKKHLFVKVLLPEPLANHVELEGDVNELFIHDMAADRHYEYDGRANAAHLENLKGHLELTSSVDMDVHYDGSMRQLDINQIRCISNLFLPQGANANVYSKGRGCRLYFEGFKNMEDSDRQIELNGYKSELTVKIK